MRIVNPNDATQHFYAGTCKHNQAPAHVTLQGIKKVIKFDGKKATMYDSPGSKEYLYVKLGDNWLYIKNKALFSQNELTTTKVTRIPKAPVEPINIEELESTITAS